MSADLLVVAFMVSAVHRHTRRDREVVENTQWRQLEGHQRRTPKSGSECRRHRIGVRARAGCTSANVKCGVDDGRGTSRRSRTEQCQGSKSNEREIFLQYGSREVVLWGAGEAGAGRARVRQRAASLCGLTRASKTMRGRSRRIVIDGGVVTYHGDIGTCLSLKRKEPDRLPKVRRRSGPLNVLSEN